MTFHQLCNKSKGLPQLDIGHRMGFTSYIDFLKVDEVTHPVMGGVDCYRRPFIVFKVKVDGKLVMETIFQRYTGEPGGFWMSCGHATPYHLLETSGGMKQNQVQFYLDLFEKGEMDLNDAHRPENPDTVGKKVVLVND